MQLRVTVARAAYALPWHLPAATAPDESTAAMHATICLCSLQHVVKHRHAKMQHMLWLHIWKCWA
jgi:hypothetical protein